MQKKFMMYIKKAIFVTKKKDKLVMLDFGARKIAIFDL